MESYYIKDIQKILLNIVINVTNLCERHNICYYLVKGGLIGAVRHQGFIPWDPDIDIAVALKDLDKFCTVLRKDLPQPFELCYFDQQKDYEYLFPRVGLKGVDYRLLHLDVFILTNAPDDIKEQQEFFKTISRIEKLNTLRNSNVFRPINSYLNRFILIICKILLYWIPKSYVRTKYLEIISKYLGKSHTMIQVGAVDEYGTKYIMPAKWFENYIMVCFDKVKLRAPKDYDSYLKQMYSDYMKLPGLKEQSKISRLWTFSNDKYLKEVLEKDEY